MLKKRKGKWSKKKKVRSDFSFNLGGVFNIFIALINYCGGYPMARGWGACSWLGVPDEYPRAMTAEVIPWREVGGACSWLGVPDLVRSS